MSPLAINRGRKGLALVAVVIAALAVVGIGFNATSASAASSKVNDPQGDNTVGTSALDIKDASVKKKGDSFEFQMKVAGSVADALVDTNQWNFIIDSNGDCQEWLFCDPDDYLIGLQANPANGEHIAFVIHLTPGPPGWTITPIPYEIDNKKITFTVQEDLIGNPSELSWYANTRPDGFPVPESDLIPDGASNGSVLWAD